MGMSRFVWAARGHGGCGMQRGWSMWGGGSEALAMCALA